MICKKNCDALPPPSNPIEVNERKMFIVIEKWYDKNADWTDKKKTLSISIEKMLPHSIMATISN